MKNVEMSVEGTVLTIKVDLSKEFGPSSTGKTIIVASTEGNVTIPDRQEKIGLNVYRKKEDRFSHLALSVSSIGRPSVYRQALDRLELGTG